MGRASGLFPLFGDHHGLPPILVQVGTDEILWSDADRFATAARDVGVAVEVECYQGLWHVFQLFAGILPSTDLALDRIARFAERVWGAASRCRIRAGKSAVSWSGPWDSGSRRGPGRGRTGRPRPGRSSSRECRTVRRV